MTVFDFEGASITDLIIAIRESRPQRGLRTINFTVTGASEIEIMPGRGILLGVCGYDASGNGYPIVLTDGPVANSILLTSVETGTTDAAHANATYQTYHPPFVNGLYASSVNDGLFGVFTATVCAHPNY